MKNSRAILYILLLILSCSPHTESGLEPAAGTPSEPRLLHVKATVVSKQTFPKQILSNGTVRAARKADLHFKTSGYLTSVRVKNGMRVSAGQVVAALDNRIPNARLQQAKIELQKARKKYRELLISYNVDTQKTSKTLLQNLALEAGLPDAEAKLNEAELQTAQSVLKAPFGGLVANAITSTGQLITPADTIATVIDPASYEVEFPLMENEMYLVKKGLPVEVSPLDRPQDIYPARIIAINPVVDAGGTVRVRARLENKHPFIEGMHTKVTVNIPLKNMLIIPKEALVIRNGKEVVFTLQNGNTVKWNYVKILHENAGRYAVSGLKEGDTVIISNNMNLTHDARVVLDTIIPQP